MRAYTQQELDELISYPKTITEAPKRDMRLEGSQWRNDMKLRESIGTREFLASSCECIVSSMKISQ